MGHDLIRDFIIDAVQELDMDYGLHGVDLCILMLRVLVDTDVVDVAVRRARFIHDVVAQILNDEDKMDELTEEFPRIGKVLETVKNTFGGESAKVPFRILLVRTGAGAEAAPKNSMLVRLFGRFAELRMPEGEPDEVKDRPDYRAILRSHLEKRRPAYESALHGGERFDCTAPFYDLVVSHSRGCEDLEMVWLQAPQGVDAPRPHPSALILSPCNCTSAKSLLDRTDGRDEAALVAYAGNDIWDEERESGKGEFKDARHQNVKLSEVENLHRDFPKRVKFERSRIRKWDQEAIESFVLKVLEEPV